MTVLGVLAGLGFGGFYALATMVTPRTREMTVTIPAAKLRPPVAESESGAEAKGEGGVAVGARADADGVETR